MHVVFRFDQQKRYAVVKHAVVGVIHLEVKYAHRV
jgi:hypothetical protein